MKSKKGFTLVELLAVIVILAIILVVAVPTIMDTIENARKGTLESTAKLIASSAEKKLLENETLGITENIKCSDVVDLDSKTYGICKITFDEEGNASVILNGKEDGKFDNMACSGTKDGITCEEGQILPGLNCTYEGELVEGAEFVHNQYTYRYKQEYTIDEENGIVGWNQISEDGWGVILTDKESTAPVNTSVCSYINGKPLISMSMMFIKDFDSKTYEIKVSQAESIDVSSWDTDNVVNMMGLFSHIKATEIIGLEYLETDNVTDMSYMFEASNVSNLNLSNFTTSNVINMAGMFSQSKAISLDLSSFDTSNVTNMTYMFNETIAKTLNLSNFNTAKVTNMSYMFAGSTATAIDVSNFNTSNVIDMNTMFYATSATTLDLTSFDTSNVIDMDGMFSSAYATTGYARTEEEAAKFNDTSVTRIPPTLSFIKK